MNYTSPELRLQLVDEYVVGTLRGGARRRFEQLLNDDTELLDLVAEARYRYGELGKLVAPTQPSEAVWRGILSRIDALPEVQTNTAPSDSNVGSRVTQNSRSGVGAHADGFAATALDHLRSRLRFWRAFAVASSVCAAALAFFIVTQTPVEQPVTVVIITHDQESTANWVVALKEYEGRVVVKPLIEQQAPPERDFQLCGLRE